MLCQILEAIIHCLPVMNLLNQMSFWAIRKLRQVWCWFYVCPSFQKIFMFSRLRSLETEHENSDLTVLWLILFLNENAAGSSTVPGNWSFIESFQQPCKLCLTDVQCWKAESIIDHKLIDLFYCLICFADSLRYWKFFQPLRLPIQPILLPSCQMPQCLLGQASH